MNERLMIYFVRKYLRSRIAQSLIKDVMYEVVTAAREVWYEDNVFTVDFFLKEQVSNAVNDVYQIKVGTRR